MVDENPAAGTITRGNLTYFPVVPGRLEFALRLRRFLLTRKPSVVAVELPWALAGEYERAILRMPKMSVILMPPDDDEEDAAACA